jgi:hypothetical protein
VGPTEGALMTLVLRYLYTSAGPCPSRRHCRQLLGILCWADRPNVGAAPWTSGLSAFLHHGPSRPQRMPPRIRRSGAFAVALAHFPRGPTTRANPMCRPLVFCDAAAIPGTDRYRVGLFSPMAGVRSSVCPHWIRSQQQAELYGVLEAVKLAVFRQWPLVSVIADNTAAVAVASTFRAWSVLATARRILRRLWYLLQNAGVSVSIGWTPGEAMPADFPSRLYKYRGLSNPLAAASADAERMWSNLCTSGFDVTFADQHARHAWQPLPRQERGGERTVEFDVQGRVGSSVQGAQLRGSGPSRDSGSLAQAPRGRGGGS